MIRIIKCMLFTITFLFSLIVSCKGLDTINCYLHGDFKIYIAESDSEIGTPVDDLILVPDPFLSIEDIISYTWENHLITYSDTVHERLKTWGNILHRIFVVIVGNERIYWGCFMDDLDSGSCQNPVIRLIPRHPDGRNTIPSSIAIERGYPEYYGLNDNPDWREDGRIHESLICAGVII